MITIVHLIGDRKAKFTSPDDAHEYAQFWSERHQSSTVEVSNKTGLVGQYKRGYPTPEFSGRDDAWFPAASRAELQQRISK